MTDRTDSDLDLDVIRARADAATPGPWTLWDDSGPGVDGYTISGAGLAPVAGNYDYEDGGICGKANAEFIVAARTDVPALLAEVERLRAEVERLQEAVVAVDAIRHAIADPGAWVRRVFDPEGEPRESVSAWSARAVVALLAGEARRA